MPLFSCKPSVPEASSEINSTISSRVIFLTAFESFTSATPNKSSLLIVLCVKVLPAEAMSRAADPPIKFGATAFKTPASLSYIKSLSLDASTPEAKAVKLSIFTANPSVVVSKAPPLFTLIDSWLAVASIPPAASASTRMILLVRSRPLPAMIPPPLEPADPEWITDVIIRHLCD